MFLAFNGSSVQGTLAKVVSIPCLGHSKWRRYASENTKSQYRGIFFVDERQMSGTHETVSTVVSGPTNDQNRFFRVRVNFSDGVCAGEPGKLHQLVHAEAVLGEKLLLSDKMIAQALKNWALLLDNGVQVYLEEERAQFFYSLS